MRNTMRHLWGERRRLVGHWLIVTLSLVILVGLLAGITGPPATWLLSHRYDPYFQIWTDGKLALNLDEALDLAKRLDRLMDKVEKADPEWIWGGHPEYAVRKHAVLWAAELAPMYQYEGLSRGVVYPAVLFLAAPDGQTHNHLGGRSNCEDWLLLNLRFNNPISEWHERNWLAVLAHELAHNHQGPDFCGYGRTDAERAVTEATAQLMSWEVLASLATKGNKVALYALLDTLLGDVLSTAQAYARRGSAADLEKFEDVLQEIQGYDAIRWSRYQKSLRFWANDPEELTRILVTYSVLPINILATYRHNGRVQDAALNISRPTLVFDDLLYVLEHAEQLVDWSLKN